MYWFSTGLPFHALYLFALKRLFWFKMSELTARGVLIREAIDKIMARGHSRIPVFDGENRNIVGVLLVTYTHQTLDFFTDFLFEFQDLDH